MSQQEADDLLQKIKDFRRPVTLKELEISQDEPALDKLVEDGHLKTLSVETKEGPLNIYFISPSFDEQDKQKELQQEIAALKEKVSYLNTQLDPYSKILKEMSPRKNKINKLHDYNEIKDAAQIVLGKLAELEGVMTVELYEKYGLSRDD